MRIIYKQPLTTSVFQSYGIKNCYFKELLFEKDIKNISKKEHHHTFFEVHIILNGSQSYEISEKKHHVKSGSLILIPPKLKHLTTDFQPDTKKISINFNISDDSSFAPFLKQIKGCIIAKMPKRIDDNIKYILEESKNHLVFSQTLMQNRVLEIIILLMRICGFKEEILSNAEQGEDARLLMAKQYIKDNIELNLKLSDVASYCYLGAKQLTRLFKTHENTTPALYIQTQKFHHIEKLLIETDLSLKEISEKMNFSSEYHFNSFFKKIAGTPPGEYRNIIGK